jgi:hypothetical protein
LSCLAKNIVQLKLGELEGLFNAVIGALAKVGIFGTQVTGMADGTDLETSERYTGRGQVTRTAHREAKRGRMHALEVTAYGWKALLLLDAATKMPSAVKVEAGGWAFSTSARASSQPRSNIH